MVALLVIGIAVTGLGVLGTMMVLGCRPGRDLGLQRVIAVVAAVMGFVMAMVVPEFRILTGTRHASFWAE